MTVFPVPATSYIVGRFDINIDGNHNPGTIEVDVYPMYVTDRGHVATDMYQTLAHVEIPDTGEWGGDGWLDTGTTNFREEVAAIGHDVEQAVDAALAMARIKLQNTPTA